MKLIAVIFLSLLSTAAWAQSANDTFHLYFDINISELSPAMQHEIDLLLYNDRITQRSDVTIVGYADYLGTEGHNKTLSVERSRNVEKYLLRNGLNARNIKLCVGKGEVERRGLTDKYGYPKDRRVDIVVNGRNPVGSKSSVVSKKPKTKVKKDDLDDMSSYKAGQTFVLKNIYFYAQRHTVKPESYPQLDKLFNALKNNPKLKISIEGHVCCIVDYPDALDIDNNDLQLSVNRAKTIYRYLIDRGIDPKRLRYQGFGRSRPIIAEEHTEAEADMNRRVEIRVLEN